MRVRTMLVAVGLVALSVASLSASGAGGASTLGGGGYRIIFGTGCYGAKRAYSMLPDGSGLTPLLPPNQQLTPLAISRDGSTIAYRSGATESYTTWLDKWSGAIYVSRADGTGLHRVAAEGSSPTLSRDGKRLAFRKTDGIWVVGTNGRGLRHLAPASPNNYDADWSPDGKALVLGGDSAVVVQPLHGKRRVLVPRGGGSKPKWSPDGRWIAYETDNGLSLIRPNGAGKHRVKLFPEWLSWSSDGRRLAVLEVGGAVDVVGADGRGLRRLALGVEPTDVAWSPDGRQLALIDLVGKPPQLAVAGSDGRGLRRLTSACANTLVGWTRLTPRRPPAPPSERVLSGDTVATRDPVESLSADGAGVAFVTPSSPTDCEHVDVWTAGQSPLARLDTEGAPCRAGTASVGIAEFALAGERVAWASWYPGTSNDCVSALSSATLAAPRHGFLANTYPPTCRPTDVFHLQGAGDLLVFNDGSRLVRIGGGTEPCSKLVATNVAGIPDAAASICATLRRGADAAPVVSVSGGLIATARPGVVTLLDERGKLVRAIRFSPADVSAARLDGDRLVVWRFGRLESYKVTTGARELSRRLPVAYRLEDVDGGIAVLLGSDTIMLLRLADGHSFTIKRSPGPLLADLEPVGLYYSYAAADGGGRVVFLSSAELVRQLDQGKP